MRKQVSRLGMYQDVREILDAALASGGGQVELPSHGQAVHWRHRAYKFRKIYAETVDPQSPYDRLTFRVVDADSSTVVIKSIGQPARFTPAEGQPPVVPQELSGDGLFDLAQDLLKKIGETDAPE